MNRKTKKHLIKQILKGKYVTLGELENYLEQFFQEYQK
jgi:hypothetical protein